MSGGFEIGLGRSFLYEGVRIDFKGRARDRDRTYLFEDATGIQIRFNADQLVHALETNTLRDWLPRTQKEAKDGKISLQRVSLHLAKDEERRNSERKNDYCMTWRARPGTPLSERGLRPLIEDVHARRIEEARAEARFEPCQPCVSTVQKWIRKWRAAGETQDALVPQTRMKGNRRGRLPLTLQELIWRAVDELYLDRMRRSIAKVHAELIKEVKALNERRLATEKLPEPG